MDYFCPRCGSVLKFEKTGNKIRSTCPCGYTSTDASSRHLAEKPKNKEIRVLEGDNTLAVYDHKCPRCGHDKAQIIEKGIQYSDEDDLVLFKCGKCGHVHMMEAKTR